jgi:high-affinity iron transporter
MSRDRLPRIVTHIQPGSVSTNGFWQLANSLVGWNNTATYGSIGAYIAYWLVVATVLLRLKWKEGRMSLFGRNKGRRIALGSGSHTR